ncbi:MAG: Bro-N domain-containing protein, partial [Selenomonadaceae bacterium]|nr:Bro-N domain-containing protein [Selenomonadaceae bacterium]
NADGSFDKNENNIEWLRMMSKSDHSIYHHQNRASFKRICPQCGKEFETNNSLQKYCTKSCAKRHAKENALITRICPVCQKSFRVPCSDLRIACSDECEAELRRTKLPVAYEQFANMTSFDKNYAQGEMVMRTCPICGRAFPASRAKARIACSLECGAIVASVARAHRRAMEDQMHWNGEFLKLINKTLGVEVRTQVINGEPWFVAKDVCDALDIKNSRDAVARLDDDEKQLINVADNTVGSTDGIPRPGNPNMAFVNEFGLYRLVLESRKPEAEEFKRWIIHEVLPALRKYGSYVMKEEAALSDTTDVEEQHLTGYRSLSDPDRQLIDCIIKYMVNRA